MIRFEDVQSHATTNDLDRMRFCGDNGVNRLLNAYESPRPAALMRIALCAILLWDAIGHWPHVVELYSTAGLVMPLPGISEAFQVSLSPAQTVLIHSLFVGLLVASLIGWWTQVAMILAASILLMLCLIDYPMTLRKDSVIAIHLLVLLSFTRCDAMWSLDRWLSTRRVSLTSQPIQTPLSPELARQLIRILLMCIYWGAAMTKFRTDGYFNGELIEFSLIDERWGRPVLGHWLATFPKLLAVMAVTTVMLEVCLPVLLFSKSTRRLGILLAAAFHIGLLITMRLDGFSPVMLIMVSSFVTEADLKRWLPSFMNKPWPQMNPQPAAGWRRSLTNRSTSAAVLAVVLAMSSMLGLLWQRTVDTYGAFGGRPSNKFVRISHKELLALNAGQFPPVHDYFHAVVLGDRTNQRRAIGKTTGFQSGETMIVVARLMQPHPEMDIQISVVSEGETVWSHDRVIAEADSNFYIGVEVEAAWKPGRYEIHMYGRPKIEGRETMTGAIARIPVEIVP